MKKKILLVDDDASILQSLAHVLISEGYVPLLAKNGKDALALAGTRPVDLVILDLNMPIQDGWQTFQSLGREFPLLPTIIMTARSNQLFSSLAAGAGALLEKPLDIPHLLQTIQDLLTETVETRLARVAGKAACFRYFPSTPAA